MKAHDELFASKYSEIFIKDGRLEKDRQRTIFPKEDEVRYIDAEDISSIITIVTKTANGKEVVYHIGSEEMLYKFQEEQNNADN